VFPVRSFFRQMYCAGPGDEHYCERLLCDALKDYFPPPHHTHEHRQETEEQQHEGSDEEMLLMRRGSVVVATKGGMARINDQANGWRVAVRQLSSTFLLA
jgi:hypothetical protein